MEMSAKILVVDDEPDFEPLILQRFRREVRSGDFDFRFARDGRLALTALEMESDIEVMLCDITMPNMDGLSLLEQLHGRGPLLKTVMVSAYGDMNNIRAAMNRGAFDFVTKPVDFGDLRATIDKTLSEVRFLRDLLKRQETAERARVNLSRYFAPSLVETLAGTDEPFGAPREQNVAVLFADMVGFTPMTAKEKPQRVFELLRAFHSRLAHEVFQASGTLDKYIGDGLMAIFGAPFPGARDAANALACARSMLRSVGEWNAERRARVEPEIKLAVGVHYGPVLLGNIGDERRLEFATIGETVNVASRLEGLTRLLNSSVILSDALVAAVRKEGGEAEGDLAAFRRLERQRLRGYDQEMALWVLADDAGAVAGSTAP
jgi:adenylate cyclase